MDATVLKQIIDELFALLEQKVANKAWLVAALQALNLLADGLIPTLLGNLKAKSIVK